MPRGMNISSQTIIELHKILEHLIEEPLDRALMGNIEIVLICKETDENTGRYREVFEIRRYKWTDKTLKTIKVIRYGLKKE